MKKMEQIPSNLPSVEDMYLQETSQRRLQALFGYIQAKFELNRIDLDVKELNSMDPEESNNKLNEANVVLARQTTLPNEFIETWKITHNGNSISKFDIDLLGNITEYNNGTESE